MKFSTYDPGTKSEIKALFTEVFSAAEEKSEGLLIGNLVDEMMSSTPQKDLYGFVATENQGILGCIFFSRMTFTQNPIKVFILSPVAVHSQHQQKGIGQQLINYGLEKLKEAKVEIVLTYGDPNFYTKVGFKQISEEIIKAPLALTYPHGWLGQSLTGNTIQPITETPKCVVALNKPEYW